MARPVTRHHTLDGWGDRLHPIKRISPRLICTRFNLAPVVLPSGAFLLVGESKKSADLIGLALRGAYSTLILQRREVAEVGDLK
jgi:hypothetical protein